LTSVIVIPAFDEAESIGSVVAAVARYGTPLVVDDGSRDDTGACAKSAGAVVVRQTNGGYDAALAAGFAKAETIGAESIVTIDADGQLNSAAIPAAIERLVGGASLVLGVRSTGPARWSEVLFNFYCRWRFGVPDILCGLKGFSVDAYRSHRPLMERQSVHTALALALLREGAPFALVSVDVKPRHGQSRFGGALKGELRILGAFFRALLDDIAPR
jgi:glycosyltransferase involved in cell wall biosynthesis